MGKVGRKIEINVVYKAILLLKKCNKSIYKSIVSKV